MAKISAICQCGILLLFVKLLFSPVEMASQNLIAQEFIKDARSYTNEFLFDSAIIYFDSALNEAFKLNDETLEAHITRLKGRAFILMSQDDSARLTSLKYWRTTQFWLSPTSMSLIF